MRSVVLIRYIVSLLIALPIGYVLLYPEILRCHLVGYSPRFTPFTHAGEHVYIATDVPVQQRRKLQTHIEQAHLRLRQFWPDRRGQATIIYCPTQPEYEHHCAGGEGVGCSLGTPWGASFLVLGPDGNNTDVIAHELCHDELFARLGWLTVKQQVPQWFNEGLAMMVDYRFTPPELPIDSARHSKTYVPDSNQRYNNYRDEWLYRTGGQQIVLELSELETTRDFFFGSYQRVMLAYMTAGMEVSRWLRLVGRQGVNKLIQAVENNDEFRKVYRQLEQQAKQHRRTTQSDGNQANS